MTTDYLIVGSGCAGLYCALHLPRERQILMITKAACEECDSFLAQGGICMLQGEDDYDSFFADTMRAGHYENDPASVEVMIRTSQETIQDLIGYGVDFHREPDGTLSCTREGAHSRKRILFHADETGKEITSHLLAAVRRLPNVTILEHTMMVDILCRDGVCYGAVLRMADGHLETVSARDTVLATGGVGGLYRNSTNFRHLTGDGVAAALRHGVRVKNLDYVQIHPTTFYTEREEERRFLISESVRGEGATLLDKDGCRFCDELQPRDVVTAEIHKQMEKDGTPNVWLSMQAIPKGELEEHFPNIVAYCREMGVDVEREPVPVVPAQHYFMGGIWVDLWSHTSLGQLYAVGETACNGVHGRNRLASNSLLESLVFAKRAARHMEENWDLCRRDDAFVAETDLTQYADLAAFAAEGRRMILEEMEREANV